MRASPITAIATALSATLVAAGAPAAGAATGPRVADDLAPPLSAWRAHKRPVLRFVRRHNGRSLALSGRGALVRALVPRPGALSLDAMVPRGAVLELRFGASRLTLAGARNGTVEARARKWRARVRPRARWASGGWMHLELAASGARPLAIDGRRLAAPLALRGPLVVQARRGRPQLAAVVATQTGDSGGLLLHRLAALHASVPLGRFPFGTGDDRRLHLSDGWTSGLWPGSLWRAYGLTRSRLFRSWALAATLAHLGGEKTPIHDQGFRYLESSAAAFDRICARRRTAGRTCRRLKASALRAADTLVALQRGNAAAGTIPTLPASRRCRLCGSRREAETIVDSMMNVSLVEWAWRETGRARYRDVARAHAHAVARLLVRPNGSTYQAVRVRRSDGKVIAHETHQGLSANSTWSRGQAWAVYGFAYSGDALRDPDLLGVAERAADYVGDHLPARGVPPWDYSAPRGAPVDTSAGVITAAGLFRLASACARLPGACATPERWRPLAERMLTASLAHVSARPPLGFLDDQVFSRGGSRRWDDHGEFIFGTDYALEALASAG